MQLISKFNKRFRFLSCVIVIYSKFAWVIPLKDQKRITITNPFWKTLDESNGKRNKMWVDKDSEFYNRSMKSSKKWYRNSTHKEGKSVIVERFIKTLKIKFINTRL